MVTMFLIIKAEPIIFEFLHTGLYRHHHNFKSVQKVSNIPVLEKGSFLINNSFWKFK